MHGEGLLLRPSGVAGAAVIALPDADQTPEQFAGLQPGVAPEIQFARRFAERGFLVVVPLLVDRRDNWSGSEKLKRFTNAPHREWIYRQSFELGRTIIGYEIEKVLAAVDALKGASSKLLAPGAKIGIAGHGEGGMIALHAAALDPRLEAACVHGYLSERPFEEPLYRNRFGSWRMFSDPEVVALTAPRPIGFVFGQGPQVTGPPPVRDGRRGAAPGALSGPDGQVMDSRIWFDAKGYRDRIGATPPELCVLKEEPGETHHTPEAFMAASLGFTAKQTARAGKSSVALDQSSIDERQRRTVRELEEFSQTVLRDAERTRKALPIWTKLKPGAEWEAVQKQARADFWENVIGKLPGDYLKANPRTRLVHDKEKWRGYEVMLDVQPDIFAWGVLLVPKDLKPGERRPVVVCQHGLEGVPEDTITQDKSERAWNYYKGFAAQLCERGFIVYAPHNPYRGQDKFRMLQRKANPLGLSLFSFIIAQHDVTTKWLASLPFVDPERIAFYGLSYGGKTAMRVPAVLERYCLSICSGDFNEWVLKCASNTHPGGYIFTPEWEIWEWDLAHTFNYAEMALLIAPRPFMVERGHDDGVGLDEHVGYEFAKVRRGYDKLGVSERAEIEWFDGPHTINGVGTFKFLHKWLRWPERK
jgi:dienelactone hydrolase